MERIWSSAYNCCSQFRYVPLGNLQKSTDIIQCRSEEKGSGTSKKIGNIVLLKLYKGKNEEMTQNKRPDAADLQYSGAKYEDKGA